MSSRPQLLVLALLLAASSPYADERDLQAIDRWVASSSPSPEHWSDFPVEWRVHRATGLESFERLIQRTVYRYQTHPCLKCPVSHVAIDASGDIIPLESAADFSVLLNRRNQTTLDKTEAEDVASAFITLRLYTRANLSQVIASAADIPTRDQVPLPAIAHTVQAPQLRSLAALNAFEYSAYSWASLNGSIVRHTVTIRHDVLQYSQDLVAEHVGYFGIY